MRAEVEETTDGETQVSLRIGGYTLRWILPDDGEFSEAWLVNKDDEGMTVEEAELESLLSDYFAENF